MKEKVAGKEQADTKDGRAPMPYEKVDPKEDVSTAEVLTMHQPAHQRAKARERQKGRAKEEAKQAKLAESQGLRAVVGSAEGSTTHPAVQKVVARPEKESLPITWAPARNQNGQSRMIPFRASAA